jgi:hypothetical protein
VKDPAAPALLIIRMPSSYVYLSGKVDVDVKLGAGGKVLVQYSDNNGLDWKDVKTFETAGKETLDLTPFCFRRYDYRLRFEMTGAGTGLDALEITHDVQHSQLPLPLLGPGANVVSLSAGPDEGTITIEGCTSDKAKDKQVLAADFHPQTKGVLDKQFRVEDGGADASVTFPIETPGDMKRIRMGAHYRARDKREGYEMQVSFDGGESFKTVGKLPGGTPGSCVYVTCDDVPAGTRKALVRYQASRLRNTMLLFDLRIDADYVEPAGGFRPVKITYVWTENGEEKRNEHIARAPKDIYTVTCGNTPVMKSVTLELAE